jgi:Zn-dependent peptidase ImmA (M78 family)
MITPNDIFSGIQISNGQVDVYSVADYLGVGLSTGTLNKGLSSRIAIKHFNAYLIVNEKYKKNDPIFRFIAAHALGHFALGHMRTQSIIDDTMKSYTLPHSCEIEQAATQWAIALLAPQQKADEIIKSVKAPADSLCHHFNIPAQVANYLVSKRG